MIADCARLLQRSRLKSLINFQCNIWLRNSFVRACRGLSKNGAGASISTISPLSMNFTRSAICRSKPFRASPRSSSYHLRQAPSSYVATKDAQRMAHFRLTPLAMVFWTDGDCAGSPAGADLLGDRIGASAANVHPERGTDGQPRDRPVRLGSITHQCDDQRASAST